MRQKTRRTLAFIALLAFPVTMNYLSPYLPLQAAMQGIVAGSLAVFAALFISALFVGRAWCGWACPVAGLSEMGLLINKNSPNVKKLKKIRYSIFFIWAALVIVFSVLGGISKFNFFFFTASGISVDDPQKYVIYYGILAVFLIASIKLGKRGACHAFCWMSPFMVAGIRVGRALRLPQLKIQSDKALCTDCRACAKACPMSIAVNEEAKAGAVQSTDCILCGECVDACRKNALSFGVGRLGAGGREDALEG